jgi:Pycsar effector protein
MAPREARAHYHGMDEPNDAIKQVEVLPRGDEHREWRWLTEQLLERAHWELERSDEKANTLFRLYGVVLAAGVAFSVTGNSRSLNTATGSILLVAAIFGLTAGGMLAMALAPRHHRSLKRAVSSSKAPGYFGDVNAYPDTASFAGALAQAAAARDVDQWIVDQIRVVSAIVERRYRLLHTATALTWAGIVLTMCAAVAQRV